MEDATSDDADLWHVMTSDKNIDTGENNMDDKVTENKESSILLDNS